MFLPAYSPLTYQLCCLWENGSSVLQQGLNTASESKQTIFSLAESVFYNRVRIVFNCIDSLSQRTSRFAIRHFSDLQKAFTFANALLTVYSAKEIITHLNHPLVKEACGTILGSYLPAVGLALIMLYSSWAVSEYVMGKPCNEKVCQTGKSKMQIFSGTVQLTGIISSVALAALTENKISLLLKAAFSTYSFVKNNSLNWLFFRNSKGFEIKDMPITNGENCTLFDYFSRFFNLRIKQVNICYSALLPWKRTDDNCVICVEKDPRHVFCTNGHIFHKECIEQYVQSGSDNLGIGNIYKRNRKRYTVTVNQNNLPKCPICADRPSHHQLEIQVKDPDDDEFSTDLTIVRNNPDPCVAKNLKASPPEDPDYYQKKFEKVNALYSSFQATLSAFQQNSEFALFATALKSVLIVTDVLFSITTYYHLKNNFEKGAEYGFSKAFIAVASVTGLLFFKLENLFRPKEDLSSFASKSVTAEWEVPFAEKIHLILSINRLLATIGLTFFSKAHKIFNVTSVITQSAAILGGLSLPWIRVDQTNLAISAFGVTNATLRIHALVTKNVEAVINEIADLQRSICSFGEVIRSYKPETFGKPKVLYKFPEIADIHEYFTRPFIWSIEGKLMTKDRGFNFDLFGSWVEYYTSIPMEIAH